MRTLVSLAAICLVAFANLPAARCAPSQLPNGAQNPIGQDSFDAYRVPTSGEDGALAVGLAQPSHGFSGASSKRARKMSAFIPMRGRKDGRTLADSSEASDGASVWRLVGGELLAPVSPAWSANAAHVPQQFASQFVVQHQRALDSSRRTPDAGDNSERVAPPGVFAELELMKAKPRRAFHPMRGKKFSSSPMGPDDNEDGGLLFESAAGDQAADWGR